MRILLVGFAVISLAALGAACSGGGNEGNLAPGVTRSGQTPTESYKLLFAAVKRKDTEAIKALVSQQTQTFATALSQQQNKPIEKVYENGFTATTFADTLPEIRDERIDGEMGAIEVRNVKENKWEDLPFVKDEGGWKLAIGDIFKGSYKQPGKGRAVKEMEAANAARGPEIASPPPVNSNTNIPMMPANKNAATGMKRQS